MIPFLLIFGAFSLFFTLMMKKEGKEWSDMNTFEKSIYIFGAMALVALILFIILGLYVIFLA